MIRLTDIFASLTKGSLKNILGGAGLTLATAGITLTALNTAVSQFKSNIGHAGVQVLQLAHLAGFDVAISLILGAIMTRYTQKSANLVLKKKG